MSLILDSKTRWSGLLIMLDPFYLLHSCVQNALTDVSSTSFTQHEFQLISEIINSLTPIKVTVEALCRRDVNLLTADTAMSFMMDKLKEQNNSLSMQLHSALRFRITQRCNDW